MLYHCFASFKQSPLDFFKLVDSRLILMLLYDSLNLIISGFTNHIWAVGVTGQKKVKLRDLDKCYVQDVPVRCHTERQNHYPQCVCYLLTFC